MSYIQAIILAIVEALTEFLPVSSTAHLILAGKLMNIPSSDFLSSFDIFIQLGAILAVCIVLFKRIAHNKALWPKVIWAFIPTTILGAFFYKLVKEYLLAGQLITGWALIIGGIFFIVWELFFSTRQENGKEVTQISNSKAATIGIWQALAFIPGVSRSAATTFGGMFAGLKRSAAVEFAFILAIPTMLAASGLDLAEGLYKQFFTNEIGIFNSSHDVILLIVGLIVTFLVSLLTCKAFMKLMSKKNSFIYFGIYRILIGIVWLVLFWS